MCKRASIGVLLTLASVVFPQSVQAQAKTHFFRYEYPQPGQTSPVAPPSQASASLTTVPTTTAIIRVVLPDAQARVWVANHTTTSTGIQREYQSPPTAM